METLHFDDVGFGTAANKISWRQVQTIGIRTTDEGPFVEDVFWMFVLDDGVIELPGGAITSDHLTGMQTHLPGFDNEAVIRSMGSTEHRYFRVWHRDAAKLVWKSEERRDDFVKLISRLGGDPTLAADTFARLEAAWSEPHRRYHDRRHLAECLLRLNELQGNDTIALALWFHDAVYVPGAKDNEARSVELLINEATRLGIDATRAAALVRATAHHDAPARGDAALMLDIDLSILAADPMRFLEYDHEIEEEHADVPHTVFIVKRGRFLASQLARPRMFNTDAAHERFERRARAQIEGLLASPRYRSYRFFKWLPC